MILGNTGSCQKMRYVYCFLITTVLVFFLMFGLLHYMIGFTIFQNMTNSAPRGLYVGSRLGIDHLMVSDYVVISLPYKVAKYDKGRLLLKQVKGFPGDEYEVLKDKLILHGHEYPIDRSFTMLPQLKEGHYTVPEGTYLFLNVVSHSFDGRYLGPVNKEEIKAKVVPVLNYEKLYERYMAVKRWWDYAKGKAK